MTDDTKKYLHYSPIDVWMFNAAPICNVGKYGDITTTRESVTCPDCNRILDALDVTDTHVMYKIPAEAQGVAKIEDVIIKGGTILSWGMEAE